MSGDRAVVVRGFSWRDLCPWFVIFRSFRLAISVPVLLLATSGVLLHPVGWRFAAFLFVGNSVLIQDADFARVVRGNSSWPGAEAEAARLAIPSPSDAPPAQGPWNMNRDAVSSIYQRFVLPYRLLFTTSPWTFGKFVYLVIGTLWTLLVWGWIGGAITRIAVVRFGREEDVGLRAACRFALRRLRSYLAAPLFPFAGVVLVLIPSVLLGLLMRLDVGVLIASLVWPLVLVGGLVITVLMLGLMFGWPLMVVAISGEETGDMFEALHRSYSYTFQRPLHYLFYALLTVAFGSLSWFFVDYFAQSVIGMSQWATAWGASSERWDAIHNSPVATAASSTLRTGSQFINFWHGLVRTVAASFKYSFFWCAASAVYLLLRQNVDNTEFDEVFVEGENEKRSLPSLAADITSPASTTSAADTPPPTNPAPTNEASQG